MQRILVIGPPGAGKSTLARRLGEITGLKVIYLDKEFWQPGWVKTPEDRWQKRLHELVAGDSWIIDGSFDRNLDIRLTRADQVIFLDLPRYLCFWRIACRIISTYGRVRKDMGAGCPERLDWVFFKWAWNYRRDIYPRIFDKLERFFADGQVVTLRSRSQVAGFLRSIDAARPAPG